MLTATGGTVRTVGYDPANRAVSVCTVGTGTCSGATGVLTTFAYGPDGARYREKVESADAKVGPRTVYSVDKAYELVAWADLEEERFYLGPNVMVVSRRTAAGTTRAVRYLHLDHLGSVEAVTTEAGAEYLATVDGQATKVDSHGYDAWGAPRKADWTSSGGKHHGDDRVATTDRGFTGHEMLDGHGLIHMNGRVYDYRLGRFLSVDPIISNPANSQSINPYSYIGNNPLSGTDPTGYCAEGSSAETGSRICRQQDPVTQIKNQIGDALEKGTITLKTSVEDAKKALGEGFSKLVDTVKSLVSPSSGGGTTTPQPGVTPDKVGTPTRVAAGDAQPSARPAPKTYGLGIGAGFIFGYGAEYATYAVADSEGGYGTLSAPAVRTGPLGSPTVAAGADVGVYGFVVDGTVKGLVVDGTVKGLQGEAGAYNLGMGSATVSLDMKFNGWGASGGKLGYGAAFGFYTTFGRSSFSEYDMKLPDPGPDTLDSRFGP